MEIKRGKPCNPGNYTKGRAGKIQYIVIHFTANNGDTAVNNVNYFAGAGRKASAHYFVDEENVYQSVKDQDTAWHCGTSGKYYHPVCRNGNSIGIEMCSRISGGAYYISDATVENTIRLAGQLMRRYNISADRVIRHYDVTRKLCPEPFVRRPELWESFQKKLVKMEDTDMEELEKLRQEFGAYKAEKDRLINTMGQEIAQLKAGQQQKLYNYVDENMPAWAREPIQWLMDHGILKGTGEGLGLTESELRVYTALYRAEQLG